MLRDFPRRKFVRRIILYTDVFREVAVISRDDSRVESYSFDSLPAKRAALAIVLAEMQNVFVSLRPESRYIFFKASPAPYQRGPRAREWRGGGKTARGSERQSGGERKGEPPYETVICTDSAIFLHLLPPPLLSVTPLRPYPLIWNPQPNECTSTARLTSTAAVSRTRKHTPNTLDTVCHYYEFSRVHHGVFRSLIFDWLKSGIQAHADQL